MPAASQASDGVYYYGDGKIDRFLSGEWKRPSGVAAQRNWPS